MLEEPPGCEDSYSGVSLKNYLRVEDSIRAAGMRTFLAVRTALAPHA